MISALSIVALATIAQSAPATSRSTTVGSSMSYTLPAVHNTHFVRNGTAQLLKAYKKFALKPTRPFSDSFVAELQGSSLRRRQDGSDPAEPSSSGSEYIINVKIGEQSFPMDLDTGSSDLWIYGNELSSSEASGHKVYTPGDSFSAISGCSWEISYGDGSSASGNCGTDTVTIGGTTVQSQVVELATKVSASFTQDTSNDGLVGMAFSTINTAKPQAKTFFDNAADSLSSPILGAYLPYNADGAYDFGHTDPSRYSGDISYADVDSSNGFWEVSSSQYAVSDQTGSMEGFTGIADTGTTLLLMGDDVVEAYYAQVEGASSDSDGYTFPCTSDLPTLSFSIGDQTATIPSKLMNFAAAESDGTCYGSLQSVGQGTMNIYGDVFFQAYYGIFDLSGPSFGFATIN